MTAGDLPEVDGERLERAVALLRRQKYHAVADLVEAVTEEGDNVV